MMGATTNPPETAERPLRRLRVAIALALVVAIIVGILLYARISFERMAERELNAALVETDATDRDWRWNRVMLARTPIPDDENSGLRVIRALRLIGGLDIFGRESRGLWPPGVHGPSTRENPSGWQEPAWYKEVRDAFPPVRLQVASAEQLRAELRKVNAGLIEARLIADMPRGRHPIEWKRDFFSTLLPTVQGARRIADLLQYDAALRAHDGDADGALASCRGMLNAGRSLGDEPSLITQLVRIAVTNMALDSVERALAQGEPSERALALLQELLEDEAGQPLLLIGLRGERAGLNSVMELLLSGEITWEEYQRFLYLNRPHEAAGWMYGPTMLRYNQGLVLKHMTRAVEIAKRPLREQREAFAQWELEIRALRNSWLARPASLLLPAIDKFHETYLRSRARLACAIVAVAAERYRRKHGCWPDSAAELMPDFLKELPADPFAQGPVRYVRYEYGVMVLSQGVDVRPDRVTLRVSFQWDRPKISFLLLDVDKRRQPAAKP